MHIHIKKVPGPVDGFLHGSTSDGGVKVAVSFGVTSDESEFYKYIEEIAKVYFSSAEFSINVNEIHGFLILVHSDLSADIYINDFKVTTQVQFKRSLKNFEVGA